jgi:uncharacterized DUF497 family protein
LDFEFYFDEDLGQTHIEKHSVSELEIFEFFTEIMYFERERKDKSFVGIGKLHSGRYLQVIYWKKNPDLYFIITAYDLEDKDAIKFIDERLVNESY